MHGYDLNSIATLANPSNNTNQVHSFKLLSGGDEKVLRLFEAPYFFVDCYNALSADVGEGNSSPLKHQCKQQVTTGQLAL